jgi:hypothetical protein
MTRLRICALACSVVVFATVTAHAEDGSDAGGLNRLLEQPAHQALMDSISRPDVALAPFETDGCSGGLSNVWTLVSGQFPDFAAAHENRPPWETCCIAHDRVYHAAGRTTTAADSFAARLLADEDLRSCVIATGELRKEQVAAHYGVESASVMTAYGVIADAMKIAVRFGGAPCSGLPWRWGYGYPECSILALPADK